MQLPSVADIMAAVGMGPDAPAEEIAPPPGIRGRIMTGFRQMSLDMASNQTQVPPQLLMAMGVVGGMLDSYVVKMDDEQATNVLSFIIGRLTTWRDGEPSAGEHDGSEGAITTEQRAEEFD